MTRSYRELQADGLRELCPHCGQPLPGDVPVLPEGMPERSPEEAATRRAALEPTWRRVVDHLAGVLPELTLHIWIEPLVLADTAGDRLFIAAPKSIGTWAQERYALVIGRAASTVAGRMITADIYVDPSLPTSRATRTVQDDTPTEGTTR